MKHRARIHLHAFTSEVMAGVSLYGNEPLKSGSTRLVRLKLAGPIVLAPGDRFVLRQPLPAGTVGGGRVLDTHPKTHERKAATGVWLDKLARASPLQEIILRVGRRASEGIQLTVLAREMGFTPEAIRENLASLLTNADVLLVAGELLVAPQAFTAAMDLVVSTVRKAGASGLKRSELRSQTGLHAEILNAAVERLIAEHKAQLRGEVIALEGADSGRSTKDAEKMHAVEAAYRAAGLAAPSVSEVAQRLGIAEAEMRRLVTMLIREKALVRMGSDDLFVHAKPLEQLAGRLAPLKGKSIDVAGFKTLTGLTRKHAIPLLEYLDRERITRKSGDQRLVL